MADNAAAFARAEVTYLPVRRATRGRRQGLLAALAARACLVVTDEFPCFFVPRMVAAAAPVAAGAARAGRRQRHPATAGHRPRVPDRGGVPLDLAEDHPPAPDLLAGG
jgi:hypothetical protein